MAYDYSGVDPDVALILQDMDARQTALAATPDKIPTRYVVTYPNGTVATYDLTSTV